VTDVTAGTGLTVQVRAFPPPTGGRFHSELQIRHLESGSVVFRGQSHAVGAEPVPAGDDGFVDIEWRFTGNLGRGHYAVSCVILNENHGWVALSAPALLTVNERQSEQALVFVDASCAMRPSSTTARAAR
jgi:hypothetical protein